jgi:hypothetical protein
MDATDHRTHTPLDDVGVPKLPSPSETSEVEASRRDVEQRSISKHALRMQQALAVCAFLTVVIYAVQAWLMRETLKEALQTARAADASSNKALSMMQRDLRAWVIATAMEPPPYESGGWMPIEAPIRYVYITNKFRGPYFLTIQNTGKTPATELRYAVKRELAPEHSALNWDFYDKKNHGVDDAIILAPSSGTKGNLRIDELPSLTDSQMAAIKSGRLLVRVLAQMEYNDIFPEHHRTRSCFYLMRDLSAFVSCPTGNEIN